jgi:hypothetical protein
MNMNQRLGLLAALLLSSVSALAMAAESAQGNIPANEAAIALQACEGEVVGAAVEYSLKSGKVFQGNCALIEGRLVAVPVTPIQTPMSENPAPESARIPEKPQT